MEQEQLNEQDYEMASYILGILKSQQPIVWSWGIDPQTVCIIHNGITFYVQGFIMTGIVRITFDQGSDMFRVELHPDDGADAAQVFDEVYLDGLVSLIDEKVEKCENYEERVSQEYPIVIISDLLNDEDCEGK